MSRWSEPQRIALTIGSGVLVGVTTWVVTMASAPRYSYGYDRDEGNLALFCWVLLAVGVLGGLVVPRYAVLFAAALGIPPLVLSPWTAPRGDNDGLWLLIVPVLAVFVLVLVAAAMAAAWVRTTLFTSRSRRREVLQRAAPWLRRGAALFALMVGIGALIAWAMDDPELTLGSALAFSVVAGGLSFGFAWLTGDRQSEAESGSA